MKIAFFTDTYFPQLNGVTVSVDNFSKELQKKGHTVYIFAPKIRGYAGQNSNVYRVNSFKVVDSQPEIRVPILIPNRNLRQIFKLGFDIVHAHGNGPFSVLGYQTAIVKRIPFVLTFHTIQTKYAHYFLNGKIIRPRTIAAGLRIFASVCDGVVVPSNKMRKELIGYGIKKDIKILPSFIETSRFQRNEKGYLHKKLNIPETHKILLSVGRLGKEKSFDFLIEMFKYVVKNEPQTHLVIVGQGQEELNLRKLVKKLALEKSVHFTGKLDNKVVPSSYSDADIFVFASSSETQGLTVLEAAASGLPLVVVDDPAFSDIALENKNALKSPLDQKIFAQSVVQLLSQPEMRKKFGENSVKIVAENFQSGRLTEELLDYYEKIIQSRKNRKRIFRKIVERKPLIYLLKATERVNRFLGM